MRENTENFVVIPLVMVAVLILFMGQFALWVRPDALSAYVLCENRDCEVRIAINGSSKNPVLVRDVSPEDAYRLADQLNAAIKRGKH